MAVSSSISTGTFSELCGAIAAFSVKRHGIDCADSPLCASAIRVRQQNGLNGRESSVPTSSNSFSDMCAPLASPSYPAKAGHPLRRDSRVSHDSQRLLDHPLSRMMTTITLLHHRGGLAEQQLALFL